MDLGISQRQLAKRLGVSNSTIENWEGNETVPARCLLPRVSDFVGHQLEVADGSIGERLRAYRKAAGLSRRELAGRLSVHPTALLRWETGRRLPSRRLGVRIEALLREPWS